MKISIITTSYNSENSIKDTIESVLTQNYKDFEHVIVDGGSKDNTMGIIKEYEVKYNGRLIYVSEPDKGIYDAMNKGVKMASGDVVGFLNSDDFFTGDNILSKIVSEFGDIDAVFGDVHYVNDDNLSKSVRNYSSAFFSRDKMKMGFMPAHPSFYCKKTVFDKVGGFDTSFKIAADFDWMLRSIYLNNIKIKYIPLDFVTMRTGGASTSGLKSHKQIFLEHLKSYRKNGVNSNVFLESLRYAYKLSDLALFKLQSLCQNKK